MTALGGYELRLMKGRSMSNDTVRVSSDARGARRISTRDFVLCGLFSALMIVGAYMRVPFPAVPLTFQPFFAILSGLLLGARLGVLAQGVYLLTGLVGVPVFAGGSAGITYVLKPTFGFLLGFLLAAFLAGMICDGTRNPGIVRLGIASLTGLAAIYAVGIVYMYLIQSFYLAKAVTLAGVAQAMVPFLVKDLILFIAATAIALRLIPLLRRG